MKPYAIVLAAGASTRMGTCKASLPWIGGKTVLAYTTEQLLLAGIIPIVVLGTHNADRQIDCPDPSLVAINPNPDRGKISSILTGLDYLPQSASCVAICAVDQPRPAWIYQRLLSEHLQKSALITSPTYQGKLGHPLFFSVQLLPELKSICEESQGLRQIIQDFQADIYKVEFDTADIFIDFNTPESYQAHLQKAKETKGDGAANCDRSPDLRETWYQR